MEGTNWAKLLEPFAPEDIDWRVSRAGVHTRGANYGKPWCLVVPYIKSTACEERLDEVFGTSGWQSEVKECTWHSGGKLNTGFLFKLSVWDEIRGDWIVKTDGAPTTNIEAFKGGISDALKRVCASGLGIGRYLRYMPKVVFAQAQWEKIDEGERAEVKDINQNNEKRTFWWYIDGASVFEPWALPGGTGKPERG